MRASQLLAAVLWFQAITIIGGAVGSTARAQSVAPAEAGNGSSPEREQIFAYVRERLRIETYMRERLMSLQQEYGDMETSCPASLSELASREAINRARTRMKSAAEMNARLREALRERWSDLDRATMSARLPASIGDSVRASHKETYSTVLNGMNRWQEADEAFDASCQDVLSLADSTVRLLREGDDSHERAKREREFEQLQAKARRTDSERNRWHRAVAYADEGVNKLLEKALRK